MMDNVILAIQFLIDGQWVTLGGWFPQVVESYETCKELAANAAEYVRSNPHPTATDVVVGCYAPVVDSMQSAVGESL